MQAKQERKDGGKKKSSTEKESETYDNYVYDEQDVEDWEEEQDEDDNEEMDLENLVKLKGKLKSSGSAAPQLNMPLYAPPFAPAARPPFGYPTNYGPSFHPSGYPHYPGFPYVGASGPPFPVSPAYPYPPGMAPHWGMEQNTVQTPGAAAYLPPCNIVAPPQPQAQAQALPPPQQPTVAPGSVFSRIGVKDGNTPILAATLQQQLPPVVSSAPTPINDVESASEALRRVAAGYSASSTAPTPHAYQINLPVQKTPEKVIETTPAPVVPLLTKSLLANIPEPEYSSVPNKTPDKSKPIRDRKASSCSDGSYAPEEEIDNYPDFKPIIPLPEEVEVKTGEEGQDVLFDQRAKLFRFSENQWKERGVGNLKFLQDPASKKIRLLMRRDQVRIILITMYWH